MLRRCRPLPDQYKSSLHTRLLRLLCPAPMMISCRRRHRKSTIRLRLWSVPLFLTRPPPNHCKRLIFFGYFSPSPRWHTKHRATASGTGDWTRVIYIYILYINCLAFNSPFSSLREYIFHFGSLAGTCVKTVLKNQNCVYHIMYYYHLCTYLYSNIAQFLYFNMT